MDLAIFTGRVTEEDLKRAHPEEYERLVQTGGLSVVAAELKTVSPDALEVVSEYAPDALPQLAYAVMQLPTLFLGTLFEHVHRYPFQPLFRNSVCHAVLASLWIQTWSCLSTSMVRVGAMPADVSSL